MSAFLPLADPPFDPLMVADCALWLDSGWGVFNQSGTPAAVGDKIATRFDRATGNMWTQTTDANRPTLQADGLQYGSGKYLQTASPIVFTGDLTHFVVMKKTSINNENIPLGSVAGLASIAPAYGPNAYLVNDANSAGVCTSPSAWEKATAFWACIRRSGNTARLFGSYGTDNAMTDIAGTLTIDCDGARVLVGQYTPSTDRIRAQVAFNRALTPAEIQRVAGFLMRQYGAAA